MYTKKMEKPNLKYEIIKAIYILTGKDPTATVGLGFIVSQVQQQIKGLEHYPRSRRQKEGLIRSTIYSMKNNDEIGYQGRNKYSIRQDVVPTPQVKEEKIPPEYFQVPSRKRLPETSTPLDPAKRRRHSSELSLSSISGNKLEQARKQFHGMKKIDKHKFNPRLPGARQKVKSKNETTKSEPNLSLDYKHYEKTTEPGAEVSIDANKSSPNTDEARGESGHKNYNENSNKNKKSGNANKSDIDSDDHLITAGGTNYDVIDQNSIESGDSGYDNIKQH